MLSFFFLSLMFSWWRHYASKGKKNFKYLQCPRSQNSETYRSKFISKNLIFFNSKLNGRKLEFYTPLSFYCFELFWIWIHLYTYTIIVRDRVFLGMQDFNFAEILPKFCLILPKFEKNLPKLFPNLPKKFARRCGWSYAKNNRSTIHHRTSR